MQGSPRQGLPASPSVLGRRLWPSGCNREPPQEVYGQSLFLGVHQLLLQLVKLRSVSFIDVFVAGSHLSHSEI